VPDALQSYMAVITIDATDTAGNHHQTAFATGIHRPLEIYYNGNVQIAETLPPVPVSACIPGGNESRSVSYDETIAETRTRRMEMNWNQGWLRDHTVTEGQDLSRALTDEMHNNNSTAVSTTDGQHFGWSYDHGTNTNVGVMGGFQGIFFNGGGHADHGWTSNMGMNGGNDRSVTNTRTTETGLSHSETTTETTHASETNSVNMSGSLGGSVSLEVSSMTSQTRSFQAYIPAHQFGVFYRQTTRIVRRGMIVVYNMCGLPQVVGQADFSDWAWAPDLGVAPSCPPLPASNLPPAQCYVSPCSGQ
jgi:hypothetical protein